VTKYLIKQLKGGKIYFAHGFRGVSSWSVGSMLLVLCQDRTSLLQEHLEEEVTHLLVDRKQRTTVHIMANRKQKESNNRKGPGQDIALRNMSPVTTSSIQALSSTALPLLNSLFKC
jgi:hypothetical protein